MTRPSEPTADSMGDGLHVGAVIVGRALSVVDPTQQGICLQLCDDDEGQQPHHQLPYTLDFYTAGVITAAFTLRAHRAGPEALKHFHIGAAWAATEELNAQAEEDET